MKQASKPTTLTPENQNNQDNNYLQDIPSSEIINAIENIVDFELEYYKQRLLNPQVSVFIY